MLKLFQKILKYQWKENKMGIRIKDNDYEDKCRKIIQESKKRIDMIERIYLQTKNKLSQITIYKLK